MIPGLSLARVEETEDNTEPHVAQRPSRHRYNLRSKSLTSETQSDSSSSELSERETSPSAAEREDTSSPTYVPPSSPSTPSSGQSSPVSASHAPTDASGHSSPVSPTYAPSEASGGSPRSPPGDGPESDSRDDPRSSTKNVDVPGCPYCVETRMAHEQLRQQIDAFASTVWETLANAVARNGTVQCSGHMDADGAIAMEWQYDPTEAFCYPERRNSHIDTYGQSIALIQGPYTSH